MSDHITRVCIVQVFSWAWCGWCVTVFEPERLKGDWFCWMGHPQKDNDQSNLWPFHDDSPLEFWNLFPNFISDKGTLIYTCMCMCMCMCICPCIIYLYIHAWYPGSTSLWASLPISLRAGGRLWRRIVCLVDAWCCHRHWSSDWQMTLGHRQMIDRYTQEICEIKPWNSSNHGQITIGENGWESKRTGDFGGENATLRVYWAMPKSNHLGMGQNLWNYHTGGINISQIWLWIHRVPGFWLTIYTHILFVDYHGLLESSLNN